MGNNGFWAWARDVEPSGLQLREAGEATEDRGDVGEFAYDARLVDDGTLDFLEAL